METLQIEETKQREMNVWEVILIKTQPHRFHVNTGLKFDVCYQPASEPLIESMIENKCMNRSQQTIAI